MASKQYSPEQAVAKLRQIDVLLGEEKSIHLIFTQLHKHLAGGLWADDEPVAPWDWRKMKPAGEAD